MRRRPVGLALMLTLFLATEACATGQRQRSSAYTSKEDAVAVAGSDGPDFSEAESAPVSDAQPQPKSKSINVASLAAPAAAPGAGRAGGSARAARSAEQQQRQQTVAATPTVVKAGAEPAARGPLLVYTAQLTMAVFEVAAGLRATEALAKEAGGYLAQQANASITIRVPADRFEEVVRRLEKIGDIINRNIRADDVTQEFQDTEVRLKNARAVRDRLEHLLARATKVDESIAIERELERVARDIEQMEGRLKFLRDRIAYSTITVVFSARRDETVAKGTFRLPFPWLNQLGLGRLLDMGVMRERP